jgi:hypothetical protein
MEDMKKIYTELIWLLEPMQAVLLSMVFFSPKMKLVCETVCKIVLLNSSLFLCSFPVFLNSGLGMWLAN